LKIPSRQYLIIVMAAEPEVTITRAHLRNIETKVHELKLLMEVSAIISSALELDDLMPIVMEKAKSVMNAEACSILFYNKETDKLEFEVALCSENSTSAVLKQTITLDMGQGIAGWVAQNRELLVINDVTKDKRFFGDADKLTGFITKSIVAAPLIGRGGLIGVAEIINPHNMEFDPEIFQLLCKQFAIAIENARFHRESIQQERVRQQLEIAASLQKSFLPESPVLRRGKATVSAVNISATQVGGDVYDFVEPVSGTLGILIGDVSGKGISAALYMAKFISDFRYVSHQIDSPDVTLNKLNSLGSRAPMGMFLTAIYGILDLATGNLRLSVAGHPPFIHISKGEAKVTTLPSGPPLGIVPTEYPVTTIPLENGDRLLFITDGVFDAKNRGGERLGFEKIVDFAKGHLRDDQLVQEIVDHVEDFSRGTERADDLTIVEIRWGK
jgi:sigma-B regulation protein RsbU (phosphoserine phosphatase)